MPALSYFARREDACILVAFERDRAANSIVPEHIAIGLGVAAFQSQQKAAGTSHNGKAYRFNKVRDGVYHVIGTGALTVVGNS